MRNDIDNSPPDVSIPRILVIDDNPAIHEDFRKIFGRGLTVSPTLAQAEAALFGDVVAAENNHAALAAFQIDAALQGQDGLALVRAARSAGRPYTIAFIDVRMPPGWDGIETTARIWAEDPDVQVVICTAYSDYSWDEMLEKLGQSDRLVILKKPFDNIEVLQLASALSEKWRLTQQARRRMEDFEQRVAERTRDLQAKNAELAATNRKLTAATGSANPMAHAALPTVATFSVECEWNDVDSIWYVANSNVPGLVVEAPTAEEMKRLLLKRVPELGQLNRPGPEQREASLEILWKRHCTMQLAC